MKHRLKHLITKLLWWQVSRLRATHDPKVVIVAGSIGKTGTKRAVAQVLEQQMKVQWQDGNYNELISIPMVFFGKSMPHLLNPFGWLRVFISNELAVRSSYPYEVVVLEVGAGEPGAFEEIKQYLRADYGVLTAITPEHMENFANLEAVAEEEMQVSELVDTLLYDKDCVPRRFSKNLVDGLSYGSSNADAVYRTGKLNEDYTRKIVIELSGGGTFPFKTKLLGKQSIPALAAAALLANILELSEKEIKQGLESIEAFPGRMQVLDGLQGSIIIDDTYNASPEAVKAALDTLYEMKATQKIAILGQMNELGRHSESLHTEVGEYCDSGQLDLVVTIGDDANKYLAAAAEKKGCKIMRCPSPQHAADVVGITLKKEAVVLAKGSQNGVFAEEAVKELLANPDDAKKLVRQSKGWLRLKESQFQS